jgi:hypothetical protein
MVLHDLAGGVQRESADGRHRAGDLEAGHSRLQPGAEVRLGDVFAGAADDEGLGWAIGGILGLGLALCGIAFHNGTMLAAAAVTLTATIVVKGVAPSTCPSF